MTNNGIEFRGWTHLWNDKNWYSESVSVSEWPWWPAVRYSQFNLVHSRIRIVMFIQNLVLLQIFYEL